MPILALVLLLAGACNPHRDALPAPRCHHYRHCLPGEQCREGLCEAQGAVTLVVAGPVRSVRALLVAAPRSEMEVARSPQARTLAEAGPEAVGEGAVASLRFDEVPRLPLYALVWDGAHEQPCEGTAAVVAPLPEGGGHARLVLHTPWRGPCLKRPRPLHHSDRLLFGSRRWAAAEW
jgi:hypothetical protein